MTLTKVRDRGTTGISTDLQPIKSDISALALREATNESSSAFNLPNQFVDTFTDDTNLGTQTNCDRVSGYVATVYATTGEFSNDSNTILLQHFNGDYTDSSSNNMGGQFTGNNMDSSNFVTSTKKFGTHSLFLNGSDEYVYTSNLNSYDTSVAFQTTGDFTVEHWFKYYTASSETNTNRIFSMGNDGTNNSSGSTPALSYGYQGGGTTTFNTYGDYSGNYNWNQTFPAKNTDWRHIAYVRKSGTLYNFLDGVYKGSDNFLNGNNMNSTGIIYYGNRSGGGAEFFYGYIDEVRISDTDRYDTTQSSGTQVFTPNQITATNATGTLIQSANTVGSAKTEVGGTMLYKNNSGTATLGTDLKVYFSCNGGSNWTEASSYNAITPVYSTGIKQVRLGKTTCTSGTDVRYKVEWANQSSGSKETQLHGIGINY